MSHASYVIDQMMIGALNVTLQVTLVTAAALLASIGLRQSAALRCGLLTAALTLTLLIPVIVLTGQLSGRTLLSVNLPDAERPLAVAITSSSRMTVPEPLDDIHTGADQPDADARANAVPAVVVSRAPAEAHDDAQAPEMDPGQSRIMAAGSAATPTVPPDVAALAENSEDTALTLRDFVLPVVAAWCLGMLFCLLRLLLALVRLRKLLNMAEEVTDVRVRGLLQEVCDTFGRADAQSASQLSQPLGLLVSKFVGSPVTAGWRHPRIVLPADMTDRLSDEQLRLVLTHEVAHVVRRDPLVLLLQHLAASLYWPHPLIWLLNRKLARAREEACDNFVLQQADARAYSRTLLAIAETLPVQKRIAGAVCLMNSAWKLESRVSGLLDARRNSTSSLDRRCQGILIALSLVLITFAVGTTIGIAQPETNQNKGTEPLVVVSITPDEAENQGHDVADQRPPAEASSAPQVDPGQIEQAKQLFRTSRDDPDARLNALRILYPLINVGTPRNDVSILLGSPDTIPSRATYSRFLNYVIGPKQWVEIEFDSEREQVVRKVAHGLGLDPPDKPIPPIPADQRAWLADYPVAAADPENRTILRAGFVPHKPEIVRGEPLTLTMTVANVGSADFEFMFGGDYRSTGRHDRIKINVTDAAGNELVDPFANRPDFGGISWFEIITPGGLEFTRTVDMAQFRTFPGPGRYTVTCSFAFDELYTNTDRPAKPVMKSSFPFTILERTPDRVNAVLDELQERVDAAPVDRLPEVMTAIAQFGQADALPRLSAYIDSGILKHQTAAYAALPLVPGEAPLDVAIAGLSTDDAGIQSAAAEALGRFSDGRGVDALLTALSQIAGPSPVRETLLQALGTTKSERGLAILSESLNAPEPAIQFAAMDGLARMSGPDAVAALRQHVESDDLAFRFRVVRTLAENLRVPIEPQWLTPILMCRRHNSREWLDSLSTLRIWCGEDALPVLLSCVDFDVPWSHRNFWILHHAKYAKGAPEFDYIYDPNSPGTPEQHEQNRQLLERLKKLAGPVPQQSLWPDPPVPVLETDPPIDFTVQLSTLKGSGETPATVTCGFFQQSWNRNGGNSSFRPTGPHGETYQVATDVRALLSSEDRIRDSDLTAQQIAELRQLDIPPERPQIKEGLSLLYIWWQESPAGPIRKHAHDQLCNAVQAAVQQHHVDHVTFAAAARGIMQPRPVAQRAQVQMVERPEFEVQRIHPSMQTSKTWLDLKAALASSAVKYRWVEVGEDGTCRLSLEATPTSDLSHLKGIPLEYLALQHTAVRDLSPLQGMPLKRIDLQGSRIQSLVPLQGMKLTELDISHTHVHDLRPIADCRLTTFQAINCPIADLSPLTGMPLTYIDIRQTQVSDLSPVVNPELRSVQIEDCPVTDLSPLRTTPLKSLWLGKLDIVDLQQLRGLKFDRLTLKGEQYDDVNALAGLQFHELWLSETLVTDLSPLRGLPLTELSVTGAAISDLTPLRKMKLTTFNVSAAAGLDLSPLADMPLSRIGIRNIALASNVEVLRSIRTLEEVRTEGKPQPVVEFWQQYDAGVLSKP